MKTPVSATGAAEAVAAAPSGAPARRALAAPRSPPARRPPHFSFAARGPPPARAFARPRLHVAARPVGVDVGVVVLAAEDERAAEGPLLRAVVAPAAAERPFAA